MEQQPIININTNPFNPNERETIIVCPGDIFIDFLVKRFPDGFSRETHVFLNNEKLPVDNFDVALLVNDIVDININLAGPVVAWGLLGIGIGGAALQVGAMLLTPPVPDIPAVPNPESPSSQKTASASNTYRLRSNTAKIEEPIPSAYGKMRWFPDFAMNSWLEYINNKQVSYYIFCLGHGEHDLHDIYVGDSSILGSTDYEYQLVNPGDSVTLFHDNMFTNPYFKVQDILQANATSRSTLSSFQFDKPNKRMTGPSSYNFNEMVSSGDTVYIECNSNREFEGVFIVDTVSESEISFVDVSSWPGSNFSPGSVTVYNGEYSKPIIPTRGIYPSISESVMSSPKPTSDFPSTHYYFDMFFPEGIYDLDGSEYKNLSVTYTVLLRKIDTDGNYVGDSVPIIGKSMLNLAYPFYGIYPIANRIFIPNDSNYGSEWDSSVPITFYEDGVVIPNFDIHTINYGVPDGNGPYVQFNTDKTGEITFSGNYFERPLLNTSFTISGSSPLPRYETISIDLSTIFNFTSGRYRVWLYSSFGYDWNDDTKKSKMKLLGFKEKLSSLDPKGWTSVYPNVSTLAIKITGEESAASKDKFSVVTTRKLMKWDGTSWSNPVATRSIAWALADVWMRAYGAGRSYLDLDLTKLMELDAVWETRGDTFDGVFDSSITIWETLQKIARVGRAKPIFDGRQLTLFRDEAQTIYTAAFGPNNIIKDSFKIEYNFDDVNTNDGVILKCLDEEDSYAPIKVSSASDLTNPREVDFFGCVSYAQAWRESQYLSEQIKLYRRKVIFKTELVGHIPFIGDLISVTYDLPNWGQSGRVKSKSGTTITVDQELDWSGSGVFYMAFMKPNGSLSGPHIVTKGSDNFTAILDTDVTDFTFITQLDNKIPTMYQFGLSTNWNRGCVILDIKFQSNNEQATITAIPYESEIYNADIGPTPSKPTIVNATESILPKVEGLVLSNVPGSGEVVVLWNPENNLDWVSVEKSTDNINWTSESYVLKGTNTKTITATGLLYVRIACAKNPIIIGERIQGEWTQDSIIAS